jgi:integrase
MDADAMGVYLGEARSAMSISKVRARGKTRYRVRYRLTGQASESPKSRTFDTRAEAQGFEDAVRASKRGLTPPPLRQHSNQTLAAFGREYVEKYARVELAPSTLEVQRCLWNKHVLPRLGTNSLRVLVDSPELVQDFKAGLLTDGVGPGAVSKTLSILSAVFNKAVEWNRIPSNPAAHVRKPSGKRRRAVVPLSPDQVEALRSVMPTEVDRRLVSVLAYSGLRPGEALALTGADIGSRSISVTKAVALGQEKATKTGRNRVVPLLKPLADDLKGHGSGLLFKRSDGQHWLDHDLRNWRRRIWQPAASEIGIGELTVTGQGRSKRTSYEGAVPYDLRHSFASLMLAAGCNPLEVAEMLGHSAKILFETYAHVVEELRGQPSVPAEQRILQARFDAACVKNVPRAMVGQPETAW